MANPKRQLEMFDVTSNMAVVITWSDDDDAEPSVRFRSESKTKDIPASLVHLASAVLRHPEHLEPNSLWRIGNIADC